MCMDIVENEIVAKQILTEAKGYLDTGFTHSLNPYSGCVFACRYCYVRELPVQRFKDIPWGQWVDIKTNAAELYAREMAKLRAKGKPSRIFMASATDPYQPIERRAEVTRAILQQMVEHPPDFLQLQTRGPLIKRDLDLLTELNAKCSLLVSMTIETDREDVKRIFAPQAPGIGIRLKALKAVHDAGIATQASISPVLPFTPEFPKVLEGVADRVWIDTLSIGDGSMGKRSARLGMPQLFDEHGLSKWYDDDLHSKVVRHFARVFPSDRIRVSKDEAYLGS